MEEYLVCHMGMFLKNDKWNYILVLFALVKGEKITKTFCAYTLKISVGLLISQIICWSILTENLSAFD